jgi:peptidoglycan/LPS O-acetylase OafA/YrhL
MKRLTAFLTLFTSLGTLVCCAIPALLVALGAGSALAGVVSTFPQLIWLTKHKLWIFGIGGILILIALFARNVVRSQTCPTDQKTNCEATKETTDWMLWTSIFLYIIGSFVSLILPRIL